MDESAGRTQPLPDKNRETELPSQRKRHQRALREAQEAPDDEPEALQRKADLGAEAELPQLPIVKALVRRLLQARAFEGTQERVKLAAEQNLLRVVGQAICGRLR